MDRPPEERDIISRCPPPPDLAPFVEALAGRTARSEARRFPVFPTARAELIFHFGDPFLVGEDPAAMRPLARAVLLGPRRRTYGQSAGPRIDWFMVQLSPLGLRRLLGLSFAETWESEIALDECWGAKAGVLFDQLAGTGSFARRAAVAAEALRRLGGEAADPLSEAVSRVRSGQLRSVGALCRRLDVGPRRLHQRFTAETGIAPKLFLSLMRFGRHLEALHPRPLLPCVEADEPEYADDSHAIREFRRFAGVTPGAYVAQKRAGDRLVYTGAPVALEQ